MIIFKQVAALQNYLQKLRISNPLIGFVPTMGALHEGHISLIKKSKQVTDKTVCSIFVNPAQFNNPEDFDKYPVDTEEDIYRLEKAGCDILFLPDVKEVYPDKDLPSEHFVLGHLENILEGKYRPGHFQGVCMVMKRFLEIIDPACLFAGQKDYQQCLVFKKLLHLLNSATQLFVCSTEREKDGLAMSSRNLRLNEKERALAPGIYHTLLSIKEKIKKGSLKFLKELAPDLLTKQGFKVDYIEIADAEDLQIIDAWDGKRSIIILAAAHLNNIRLIDNIKYQDGFWK